MDWEHEILGKINDEGGCIFPVLDPDGKRRHMCGKETPILDELGNKRPFCAEHEQVVRKFIYQRRKAMRSGEAKKQSKYFRVGRYAHH